MAIKPPKELTNDEKRFTLVHSKNMASFSKLIEFAFIQTFKTLSTKQWKSETFYKNAKNGNANVKKEMWILFVEESFKEGRQEFKCAGMHQVGKDYLS